MTLRTAKVLLVFAVALFYSFDRAQQHDRLQLEFPVHSSRAHDGLDLPGNRGMWRAMNSPVWHTVFYISIIIWEISTMVLAWWGGLRLVRALRKPAIVFNQAKGFAIAALTLSLLMWLVPFLSIGGEWFLMWQSKTWNGQDAAFRMFTVVGIILLLLALPDTESQP